MGNEIHMKDFEFYYLQIYIYNTFGENYTFSNSWLIKNKFYVLKILEN